VRIKRIKRKGRNENRKGKGKGKGKKENRKEKWKKIDLDNSIHNTQKSIEYKSHS